ncbi:NUDIX hydrolase [Nocardioides sp. B-3]|uniref:NUDIX hydrolase n=1 Tax=Nocardioides sp. B-3 TaxID=2895565 RepID=UPI0021535A62|nr:NUDIX domain-containing protein [Nocardioides sp. B-3]UUZ58398.1 NUDIX domain-containing protein [Nocardioides sp. B-3]
MAAYTPQVPRQTVKLLLVDEEDRVLLIHAKDPHTGREARYPVGGGIEAGESCQQAAAREAREETGLEGLPMGTSVWTRDDTYRFDGREWQVHEEWLLHSVPHFDPAPAALSEVEARSVMGFGWWTAAELMRTSDTVFPAGLGTPFAGLLRDGPPDVPVDITRRSLAANWADS